MRPNPMTLTASLIACGLAAGTIQAGEADAARIKRGAQLAAFGGCVAG